MSPLILMLWFHHAHAFWSPLIMKQTEMKDAIQLQSSVGSFLGTCYDGKGHAMVLEDTCYLCTCVDAEEAVCKATTNCDELLQSKEILILPKTRARLTRSKRFSDKKFALPGTMNLRKGISAPKAKCTATSQPYSIGCPPDDWCEGCTICQCLSSEIWDCNILSYCPSKRKQKAKKKLVKYNTTQNFNTLNLRVVGKHNIRVTSTQPPKKQNVKKSTIAPLRKGQELNQEYKYNKYDMKKNYVRMKKQIYQKKLFRSPSKELTFKSFTNHTDKEGYADGVMINKIKINTAKKSRADQKVHKNCGNNNKTSEIFYKVIKRGIVSVGPKSFLNNNHTIDSEVESNLVKREIAINAHDEENATGTLNKSRMKRETVFGKNDKIIQPSPSHVYSLIHNNLHNKHPKKAKGANSTLDDKKHVKHNDSKVSVKNDTHFKVRQKPTHVHVEKHITTESCEPVVSSYSIGCPADDWCTKGCTICDCMENRKWNCYILSFCPDGKGHHFMIKQKTHHKAKTSDKNKYAHKFVTDPLILTNLLQITSQKILRNDFDTTKDNKSCKNDTFILESEEVTETPKIKSKKLVTKNKNVVSTDLLAPNKLDNSSNTHHNLVTMPKLEHRYHKTHVKNNKGFLINNVLKHAEAQSLLEITKTPRYDTSTLNEIRDLEKNILHKAGVMHKKIRLDKIAHPKVSYINDIKKSKKEFILQKIRMKSKRNSAKVVNTTLSRLKRDMNENKSTSVEDPVPATEGDAINAIIHVICVECDRNQIIDNDIELIKRHIVHSTYNTSFVPNVSNFANDLEKNSTTISLETNNSAKNNKHIQLLYKTMKKAYAYKKKGDSKQNIDSLKKIWCAQNRNAIQKPGDKTRLKALRFLRHILRKMFYGHIKNITELSILESVCDEYGPCFTEQIYNKTLKSKAKDLFDETRNILRTIFSIKRHLQLFDDKQITCNKSFNCDVQTITYIFNATCSPGDNTIKPSIHVDSIKDLTGQFIIFVDNFTEIFKDILDLLTRNKPNDTMIDRIKNETTASLFNKLKKIILKHDLNENKFIKAVLETLPNFMDKISSKDEKDLRTKGDKALEKEFADTIKKIKKMRDLIKGLEKNKNREKRHISDSDGLEFVLSTMEYWLKRKAALGSEPEQDGIDLLIEVIKNGPDVIEIQKSSHKSANRINVTRTPTPRYKTTTEKKRNTNINPLSLQYEDQRFYPHFHQSEYYNDTTITTLEIPNTKETLNKKNVLLDHLYKHLKSAKYKRITLTTTESTRKINSLSKYRKYQIPSGRLAIRTKTTSTKPPDAASEEVHLYEPVVPEVFPDDETPYSGKVFIQNSHGQDRWSDSFIDRNELLKYPHFDDDGKDLNAVLTTKPQTLQSFTKPEFLLTTKPTETFTSKSEDPSQTDFEIGPGVRLFQPLEDVESEDRKGPKLDWVDARFTAVTEKRRTTKSVYADRPKTTTSPMSITTPANEKPSTAKNFSDKKKDLDIMEKKHLNFLSSLDYEESKADDSTSKETSPDKEGPPDAGDDSK